MLVCLEANITAMFNSKIQLIIAISELLLSSFCVRQMKREPNQREPNQREPHQDKLHNLFHATVEFWFAHWELHAHFSLSFPFILFY